MSHPTDLQQARDAIRHWAKLSDEADHDIDAPYLELIEAIAAALARAKRETWEAAAMLAHRYANPEVPCQDEQDAITERAGLAIEALCRAHLKDLPHD